MTMSCCAYRNKDFAKEDVYNGNRTAQCWENEVGNFGTAEAPDFRCIFHAPADFEPIDRLDWPLAERGYCQANRLKALLVKCNVLNARRKSQNKKPLAFVLPNLSCGDIDLKRFFFFSDLICTHATFTGYANFKKATFTGHVNFEEATFSGYTDFRKVTFGEKANFYHTTFTVTGFAIFAMAKFTGEAVFKRVMFSGKVDFIGTISKGKLLLQNCHFANPAPFTKCKIYKLQYDVHTGDRVVFDQCEILGENNKPSGVWTFIDQDCSMLSFLNMDLSQVDFFGANLSDTRFYSCTWPGEPYGYVYRHDDILNDGDRSQLRMLQALYLQLKKNLEDARNYRQAGEFHYREMEIWQRLLQEQGPWYDHLILCLYRFVGDFGENYLKLLKNLVFSILMVAGLVTVSESLLNGDGFTTLTQLFSVLPERFQDGQLGVTLSNLTTRLFSALRERFQEVFFGLIPSPFQKSAFDSHSYHFVSKILIVFEYLVVATLSVLFVMAMRRRFRR